jgi:DNA repair exonuclease SbcCD nuclease subunit
MKILFTGDWQASLKNLDRCRLVKEQVIRLLRKYKPCIFVHCGDVKDAFNPVDVRVTNFLIEAFTEIKQAAASVLYIRGNHDSITTADGSPSCVPLIEALGADMVADSCWTCAPLVRSTAEVWMVPYFRDPVRQRREFAAAATDAKAILNRTVKILAFHNEVAGCERTAYTKGEGLTAKDIGAKYYDICVGGHIHRPQFLKPNIYYAGSPYAIDWGEANEKKRYLILEV